MDDECWEAGHRGDYKANHVFNDAVGCGLVSAGTEEKLLKEGIEDAYFSSLKIMTMIV